MLRIDLPSTLMRLLRCCFFYRSAPITETTEYSAAMSIGAIRGR
jgi:hypothetical protein